jgi:hypothetical protein
MSTPSRRPTNRSGQKNLHVGPPLPAGGDGGGGGGAPGGRARRMREYIEFHNPTDEQRQASFVIDTRGLPPEIRTSFVLTRLDTIDPLPSSITGIVPKGQSPSGHGHGLTGKLAEWLDRIEDELEETAGALVEGCDSQMM